MKNRMNIGLMLILILLGNIFINIQAQESTEKVKITGLTIRSNSRDNQPKRRNNLHQRMNFQQQSIHKSTKQLTKEQRTIKPNKKAIQQRKTGTNKLNKAAKRNRLNH
jgi:Mn-dependent DtxR family transcriptional regulator